MKPPATNPVTFQDQVWKALFDDIRDPVSARTRQFERVDALHSIKRVVGSLEGEGE